MAVLLDENQDTRGLTCFTFLDFLVILLSYKTWFSLELIIQDTYYKPINVIER